MQNEHTDCEVGREQDSVCGTVVAELFDQLKTNSGDAKHTAAVVRRVRALIEESDNPPHDEVVSSGMLPLLVDCLKAEESNNEAMLIDASGVFCLLAYEHTKGMHLEAVSAAGALPALVRLISAADTDVSESSMCALRNIMAHDPRHKACCVAAGTVDNVVVLLERDGLSVDTLRRASEVLRNVCTGEAEKPDDRTIRKMLPSVSWLLQHSDDYVVEEAVWVVVGLVEAGNTLIQLVVDSGIVPRLTPLLSHDAVAVQAVALQAVARIAAGFRAHKQALLDTDLMSYVPLMLAQDSEELSERVAWFLAEICERASEGQIQAVLDAGLAERIVTLLEHKHKPTRNGAAKAIINVAKFGIKKQLMHLVRAGVVRVLCVLVKVDDSETTQLSALRALHAIFRLADDAEYTMELEEEACKYDLLPLAHDLTKHDRAEIRAFAGALLGGVVTCAAAKQDWEARRERRTPPRRRTRNKTRTARSGLYLSVSRVEQQLRKGKFAKRLSPSAPIFLAAVLEYLAAEVLELAGNAAHNHKRKRIQPRHIQQAVREDKEIDKLLSGTTFAQSGVFKESKPNKE